MLPLLRQLTPIYKENNTGHSSHGPRPPTPTRSCQLLIFFLNPTFSWRRKERKEVVCFIKRNRVMEQSNSGIQLSFITSPVRVSLPPGSLYKASSQGSVHLPTRMPHSPCTHPYFDRVTDTFLVTRDRVSIQISSSKTK